MKLVIQDPEENPWFVCVNDNGEIKAMFRHHDSAIAWAKTHPSHAVVRVKLESATTVVRTIRERVAGGG